jgi:uncharacterized protein DUF2800
MRARKVSDHASRAHSKFGASSAHRWFACPGSVRQCEGVAETKSKYAEEGTRAHELLETYLMGIRDCPEDGPEGMHQAVMIAVHYVEEILDQYPDARMLLEHKFEIPSHVAPGQVFGTNDVCIYVPSMRLLYVIDYKHGAGEYVKVEGNKQLRFYGVGALHADETWVIDTVALVIIQPRIEHAAPIREEWVAVSDIIEFQSEIDEHIALALDPLAPLVPGVEQCRWCPAAVSCPARERQALATIGNGFGDVKQITPEGLPLAGDLAPERIGHILSKKKMIENWLDAVEKQGLQLAQGGVNIPGFKVVEAMARRRFEGYDPENEATTMPIARKIADISPSLIAEDFVHTSLLGITEVEKMVKDDAREHAPKGKKKEAVEEAVRKLAFLTTKRSSGNLTLVEEDDARPAVNRAEVAFSNVAAIPHIKSGE